MEDQGQTEVAQPEAPKNKIHRLQFEMTGGDLFMTYLKAWALTMVTFGIYGSWAKVDIRKALWSGITFDGQPLAYTGTGGELFFALLKLAGVYLLFVLAFAGLVFAAPGIVAYSGILWAIFIPVAGPFVMYARSRFLASRTSLMGVSFGMNPKASSYVGVFLPGMLLTIITLGFYAAYWRHNTYKFKIENSYYGGLRAIYTGKPKDLFMDYVLAVFLIPLTLGIYGFWFFAKEKNYRIRHTWIGNQTIGSVQGVSKYNGGDICLLALKNILLVMLTVGIYFPWAIADVYRYFCRNTAFSGNVDLSVNEESTNATSKGGMADVAADALGF